MSREAPTSEPPCSAPPVAHAIMFWVLTTLAMATFAPCVLVPVWVETEKVLEHERSAAAVAGDLQARADRNQARIRALLADPMVNERIIRRELNYRPEKEQVVHWPAGDLPALEVELPTRPPVDVVQPAVDRPAWVTALNQWLPAWPWRKLFAQSRPRSLLLVMAGGLLATAFLLYAPTSTPRGHRRVRR